MSIRTKIAKWLLGDTGNKGEVAAAYLARAEAASAQWAKEIEEANRRLQVERDRELRGVAAEFERWAYEEAARIRRL